jgi:hypothetical protein
MWKGENEGHGWSGREVERVEISVEGDRPRGGESQGEWAKEPLEGTEGKREDGGGGNGVGWPGRRSEGDGVHRHACQLGAPQVMPT